MMLAMLEGSVLQVNVPSEVDLSDLDGSMVSMTTGGTFTAYLTSELNRMHDVKTYTLFHR